MRSTSPFRAAELAVQVTAIGVAERAVQGLLRQFLHAQQDVGDLIQGAFRGLHEADAVGSVAAGLVEGADVCFQVLTDRQTSRIITGTIDPQAGAELFHALAEGHGRVVQVTLGVGRSYVGIDPDSHSFSSLKTLGMSGPCVWTGWVVSRLLLDPEKSISPESFLHRLEGFRQGRGGL
jgi:hypothetical protein